MKRIDITQLYNILSKTTTDGLEERNVSTILVKTSMLKRVGEETDALIKGVDEKCPSEIKDLKEIPKGEDERAKLMITQDNWRKQKNAAEEIIMTQDVEFDSKIMTQEEALKFIAKQSELKTTEKAILLELLSK